MNLNTDQYPNVASVVVSPMMQNAKLHKNNATLVYVQFEISCSIWTKIRSYVKSLSLCGVDL